MRRSWLGLVLALGASLAVASPAFAVTEWGRARLISVNGSSQGQGDSFRPALSGDGRRLAFLSVAANLIPPDVPPAQRPPVGARFGLVDDLAPGGRRQLIAPAEIDRLSLSDDGRYVAFDTTARLDPVADTNSNGDVYVRDLSLPADAPGAFTVASAPDGAVRAVATSTPEGSATPPQAGISGDGRRVLFRTSSSSDLAGADTPPGQLAVRDLVTRRTALITTRYDQATKRHTDEPLETADGVESLGQAQAALSRDGSTVLFRGGNVEGRSFVPRVPGESTQGTGDLFGRRLDGPGVAGPAWSVLGQGDSADPACDGSTPGDPTEPPYPDPGPCESPLLAARSEQNNAAAFGVAVDGAGRRAAFFWGLRRFRASQLFRRNSMAAGLANLGPSLPLKGALTEMARQGDAQGGLDNPQSIALSADSRWLTLVGQGGRIAQPGPISGDADPDSLGCGGRRLCLHAIDLERGVSRVAALGFDGKAPAQLFGTDPSEGEGRPDWSAPAISADGSRIAFSTDANTLVFGDANNRDDVFVVDRFERTPPAGRQILPPPPAPFATRPDYRLSVRVARRRDGALRVFATVPGAGRVVTGARSRLRGWRRARKVASASTRRARPGVAELTLRPGGRALRRARRRGGLPTTVTVRFSPASGRALRSSVTARFKRAPVRKRGRR